VPRGNPAPLSVPLPHVHCPGCWYASPATHIGHELIAEGMLILAGGGRGVPLDYGELERWTRVGFERGTRSRQVSDDRPLAFLR
jgi:hypothetical protein